MAGLSSGGGGLAGGEGLVHAFFNVLNVDLFW